MLFTVIAPASHPFEAKPGIVQGHSYVISTRWDKILQLLYSHCSCKAGKVLVLTDAGLPAVCPWSASASHVGKILQLGMGNLKTNF